MLVFCVNFDSKICFPIRGQTTALIYLAVSLWGLGAAVLDIKLRSGCPIPGTHVSLYFVRKNVQFNDGTLSFKSILLQKYEYYIGCISNTGEKYEKVTLFWSIRQLETCQCTFPVEKIRLLASLENYDLIMNFRSDFH